MAVFPLAACGSSTPYVERPKLATLPSVLMQPVAGPAPGVAAAYGRPAKQTALWGQDRANLAVCRARLDGLQTVIKTERGLLVGPAVQGAAQ